MALLDLKGPAMEPDTSRDERIRALFRRVRKSYPRWSTQALVRKVWPERPFGSKLCDVLRVASEFERKDAA
jgi:hypothetical protein